MGKSAKSQNKNTTSNMAVSHLDVGRPCSKYLLYAVNTLFVLTGIMIIVVGTQNLYRFDFFYSFFVPNYCSLSALLVLVGVLTSVVAFFGWYGAFKENNYCVLVFAVSLSLILLHEVAVAIAAYVLQDEVIYYYLKNKIIRLTEDYESSMDVAQVADSLQSTFHCCGVDEPSDWQPVHSDDLSLPMSCCLNRNGIIGEASCALNSTNLYKSGCLPKFFKFIRGEAVQIGGTGLGLAFVQVVGVWYAIYQAKVVGTIYATV